jgi:arginyl-tRNA synthetase
MDRVFLCRRGYREMGYFYLADLMRKRMNRRHDAKAQGRRPENASCPPERVSEKIGVKKLRFAVILGSRNANLQCLWGKAFLDKR